ncbi:MAG: phytanoyl-CoA dioxygenase family protein [Verrucomicrobiota bacterium]
MVSKQQFDEESLSLHEGRVSQYRAKGYVLLPKLVSQAELAVLREEIDGLFAMERLVHPDNLRAQGRETIDGGYVVDRLDPLIDVAPGIRRLATSPSVLEKLGELMGEEVLLFKDKLIYKPPGATGYRTHQDYTYWVELPAPGECIVSLAVALDDTTAGNGATEFFPGCHSRHLLDAKTPEDVFAPDKGLIESASELEAIEPEMVPLEAGDGVAFSSLTPHRSEANLSGGPRRQLFLTYAAARYGDLYEHYYSLFHGYLRNDRERAGRGAQTFFS